MTKFHELFAYYAKHLERYFSTLECHEGESYSYDFHLALIAAFDHFIEEHSHDTNIGDLFLSNDQLSGIQSALGNAYKECCSEEDLRNTLHRFNYPNRIFAPQKNDFPVEFEIYKDCCPIS
jgi:hypothetical protein